MQFVADENLDWPIIEQLRAGGHLVIAVVELSPGISDPGVLAIANRNGAVLLTADKDFGESADRIGFAQAAGKQFITAAASGRSRRTGKALLRRRAAQTTLRLVESKTLGSGSLSGHR